MPNHLLSTLSEIDRNFLASDLELVSLARHGKLEASSRPREHAYFIETGIAVATAQGGQANVAIGLIGCEGASGMALMLGDDRSPNNVAMLTDGTAHRVTAQALHNAMDARPNLRSLLLRYCLAFNHQASQTALTNAVATIQQRVARWILMSEDRAAGIELKLTHETIAAALGVRRASVTTQLGVFAQEGLIKLERGMIAVVDRSRIQKIADSFYGFPEQEYQRLISSSWPQAFNRPPTPV